MTWQIAFVFGTILVAPSLFVSERFRNDAVALAVRAAPLAAGGLIPVFWPS